MTNTQRSEPRERVDLPLQLGDGRAGIARDISASGLFIETDSEQRMGGLVDVEIELDTPGGPMRLKAQGRIVRIESQGGRNGVAVKLVSSRLEPVK
jgi:hypothetical protein